MLLDNILRFSNIINWALFLVLFSLLVYQSVDNTNRFNSLLNNQKVIITQENIMEENDKKIIEYDELRIRQNDDILALLKRNAELTDKQTEYLEQIKTSVLHQEDLWRKHVEGKNPP